MRWDPRTLQFLPARKEPMKTVITWKAKNLKTMVRWRHVKHAASEHATAQGRDEIHNLMVSVA